MKLVLVVFSFACLWTSGVICIGNTRISLVSLNSDELCVSSCLLRVKACFSYGNSDKQCHVFMNTRTINSVLKFSYLGANLGDVEAPLHQEIKLSIDSLQFYDGADSNSNDTEVSYMHNVTESGNEKVVFTVYVDSKSFRAYFLICTQCSQGSSAPLCTCDRGTTEWSLVSAEPETARTCVNCVMTATICLSLVDGENGNCENYTSATINGQEIFEFPPTNNTKIHMAFKKTLWVSMILVRSVGSGEPETLVNEVIGYEIAADGTVLHSTKTSSNNYIVNFLQKTQCDHPSFNEEENDCFARTTVFLDSVEAVSNSSKCQSASTCSMEITVYFFMRGSRTLDRASTASYVSTALPSTNETLSFPFNNVTLASFKHSFPGNINFNIFVTFKSGDIVLSKSISNATVVSDVGKVEQDLQHDINAEPFRFKLRYSTTRLNTLKNTPCITGYFNIAQVTGTVMENGAVATCPAGPGCFLQILYQVTHESGYLTVFRITSKHIVDGGEELKFVFDTVNVLRSHPSPNAIEIQRSIFIISGNVFSDFTQDTRQYFGCGHKTDETILINSTKYTYQIVTHIEYQCDSALDSLYQGKCSDLEIEASVGYIGNSGLKCPSGYCLLHAKVCLHDKKPINEGKCYETFSYVIFTSTTRPLHFQFSGHSAKYNVKPGATVFYSVFAEFYENGVVANRGNLEGNITAEEIPSSQTFILTLPMNNTQFTAGVVINSLCVAGGEKLCRERDHPDCDYFRDCPEYHCQKHQDIRQKYCPYMCGYCNECDRPRCLWPTCRRSDFGCAYRPTSAEFFSPSECKNMGIHGADHHLCQLTFGGRNRFHPCHRCKYHQYAKDICPITCGLCPAPCSGKKCLNGGQLQVKDCKCECPALFGGENCQIVNCPPTSEENCNWPLWYCQAFWIPKQCARRCGLCGN